MTPEAAQAELKRRLRKYFVAVVAMLLGAFLLPPLILAGLRVAGLTSEKSAGATAAIAGLLLLTTVVTAWVLVFKWWRCPACDRNIYWLVSWNMSAFAPLLGKRTCPQCNIELFSPRSRRGSLAVIAVVVGVFIALGAVGAVSAQKARQKKLEAQQSSQPAPTPPPAPSPAPPG